MGLKSFKYRGAVRVLLLAGALLTIGALTSVPAASACPGIQYIRCPGSTGGTTGGSSGNTTNGGSSGNFDGSVTPGHNLSVVIGAFTVEENNSSNGCSDVTLTDQTNSSKYDFLSMDASQVTPLQTLLSSITDGAFTNDISNAVGLQIADPGGAQQFLATLNTGASAISGFVGTTPSGTNCLAVGNIVGN